MIKAEDLRIGDLVIVNENCSLEQGTIGKVSEVRSTPLYKTRKRSEYIYNSVFYNET